MSPRVSGQPTADEYGEMLAPDGYRVEWVEGDPAAERLATPDEALHRKCRRPGCQWVVVWALLRTSGWWLYCRDHHYGRKIEDGKILHRRVVPIDAVLGPCDTHPIRKWGP